MEVYKRRKFSPVSNKDLKYHDIAFLFAFAANFVLIVSIALSYGMVALTNEGSELVKVNNNGYEQSENSSYSTSSILLFGMMIILFVSVLLAILWIYVLSKIASYIINALLLTVILLPIMGGIVMIALGFALFGLILISLSVFILVFSLFIQPRMDFAAANLSVACVSILRMPSIFVYSLVTLFAQALFIVIWCVAAVGYATNNYKVSLFSHGVEYNTDQCTTYMYTANAITIPEYDGILSCSSGNCKVCICDGSLIGYSACVAPKLYGWAYCFLLLSLFWTSAVISNIMHCTTASAVSFWWRTPDTVNCKQSSMTSAAPTTTTVDTYENGPNNNNMKKIVQAAPQQQYQEKEEGYYYNDEVKEGFIRACSTSLGSISLASLLVAIVRTMRTIVYISCKQIDKLELSSEILRTVLRWITSLLKYILTVLDRVIVYFNRYALCFVAIHRCDFVTGSKAASHLLIQRGLTTLLNDDIIDVVVSVGHIITGSITMAIGYLYGSYSSIGHVYTLLLTVFGFTAGYLVSTVALSTISSAVSTVYVSYIENPNSLQTAHPVYFQLLTNAWNKVAPPSTVVSIDSNGAIASNSEAESFEQYVPNQQQQSSIRPLEVNNNNYGVQYHGSSDGNDWNTGEQQQQQYNLYHQYQQQHHHHPSRTIRGTYKAQPVATVATSAMHQQQQRYAPIANNKLFSTECHPNNNNNTNNNISSFSSSSSASSWGASSSSFFSAASASLFPSFNSTNNNGTQMTHSNINGRDAVVVVPNHSNKNNNHHHDNYDYNHRNSISSGNSNNNINTASSYSWWYPGAAINNNNPFTWYGHEDKHKQQLQSTVEVAPAYVPIATMGSNETARNNDSKRYPNYNNNSNYSGDSNSILLSGQSSSHSSDTYRHNHYNNNNIPSPLHNDFLHTMSGLPMTTTNIYNNNTNSNISDNKMWIQQQHHHHNNSVQQQKHSSVLTSSSYLKDTFNAAFNTVSSSLFGASSKNNINTTTNINANGRGVARSHNNQRQSHGFYFKRGDIDSVDHSSSDSVFPNDMTESLLHSVSLEESFAV